MNISLIQTELFWENKEINITHFTELIEAINEPTDLIVLPEMFATGFSMNTSFAEKMDGAVLDWMKRMSTKKNSALCGSLMIEESGKYYNRFIWVNSDGTYHTYNKCHLFRMGEENNHYSAGAEKNIIQYKGAGILPAVCYDIRFPVWLRRTKENNYDLLLVVANWPERRNTHWKTLLQARAIENQCYVVAVNRVGLDGHGVSHSGDSSVINPKGEVLFQQSNDTLIHTFSIDINEVTTLRNSFPVIEDADSFTLD